MSARPLTGRRPLFPYCARLLDRPQGYVIIDHKTFPGTGESALRVKTREFLPQLAAYAEALRRVPGATVAGGWVHFPVAGAMVELGA